VRELQVGETIAVEDHNSVEVWSGRVVRAAGSLLVLSDDETAPPELRPSSPVRVGFGDGRWYVKVRGRVLERDDRTVKIGLVGQEQRIQRRTHLRVPMNQQTEVVWTRRGVSLPSFTAELVDVSEGGCRLLADVQLFAGDWVKLGCNLDGTIVELSGAIVRTWPEGDKIGAGVRTLGASNHARYAISRFVIACNLAPTLAETRGDQSVAGSRSC